MDRWGWEWGAVDPTPKKTAHRISADTTHIHRHTHKHKTQEKKVRIRDELVNREHFSSLISIACLMGKTTCGFCGQGPSLITLKRNTTQLQLEVRALFSIAVYVEQSWGRHLKKNGGEKAIHFFSNPSNQLWSASVSRDLMFQMNTINMWWFDFFVYIPTPFFLKTDFPLQCCQLLYILRLLFFFR